MRIPFVLEVKIEMTTEEFLHSSDFALIMDELMQTKACEAAEKFLDSIRQEDGSIKPADRVDPSQIHSIQDMIRGGGLYGLRLLAKEQKSKNTNKKNKRFWEYIYGLIEQSSEGKDRTSLYDIVMHELELRNILEDEQAVSDKLQQRGIRKRNRATIEEFMNRAVANYFEHFNCHYLYRITNK
jgi:hypothetical protein